MAEDRDGGKISADDLLKASAQRGEKSSADLGYGSNTGGSYKHSTYSADSSYKNLNENADPSKYLTHSDGD